MDVPLEYRAVSKFDSEKYIINILKKKEIAKVDAYIVSIVVEIGVAVTGCYQALDVAKLSTLAH